MQKPRKAGKQTVVIASVVVGVISMLIMNLIKNRLTKIPFFTRLFQLQDIGVNSMQDFLEVSELNLRVEENESEGGIKIIYDGVRVEWDSDKSSEYIVFISSEYIHKIKLLDSDNIEILKPKEIGKLAKSTKWIRKIYVRSPNTSDDQPQDSSDSEDSGKQSDRDKEDIDEQSDSDEDNPTGVHSNNYNHRYNISAKLDTVFPHKPKNNVSKTKKEKGINLTDFTTKPTSKNKRADLAPTFCQIPFEKFNCRVRSSNGRVSRHLTYPIGSKPRSEEKEIDAWITKRGVNYYINVLEPDEKKAGQIFEYQVLLYMRDGKGTMRTLPPFSSMKYGLNVPDKPVNRDIPIQIKLGPLPTCLCYIIGIRGIGARFEQFVSWIGEDEAMSLNGLLDDFDMDNLQFEE